MAVDLEVGSATERFEERLDAAILELDDRATTRADQMMVVPVGDAAQEIRVAAVRLVQPVKDSMPDEQIEGPKDRRPPDARQLDAQPLQEIVGRERAIGALDRAEDGAPWTSQTTAGIL